MYKLLIKVSNQQKQIFSFSNSITIGRDEKCDLILPDPSISSQHARIHVQGDSLITEDLGSKNGIVVDNTKIKRTTMQNKIQIGNTTWKIFIGATYRSHL